MIKADVDFRGAVRGTRLQLDRLIQNFAGELAKEFMENMPVQTGVLRASTYLAINDPNAGAPSTEEAQRDAAPNGLGANYEKILAKADLIRVGDVFYVATNAPYAKYVEFGTSIMGPRAYRRRTLNRLEEVMRRAKVITPETGPV